ncbi:MAG: DapH/DapD/GlmU-related protein [Thermoplasmatota archaeon]
MISRYKRVHENVRIGANSTVEDFVIIDGPGTIIGQDCMIRSHTVIYPGNVIGDRFQTGNKTNIREHNIIGDDVSIGTLSVVEHHVKIENGVRVHSQAFIPEYCILNEKVWIGPNVVLTNARYPRTEDAKENLRGVVIRKGARIGANSTVLPGVNIGEYSLIGAGSVVVRDTLPQGIYMGNPAKRKGWSCLCGHPLDNGLTCKGCGKRYVLEKDIPKAI